jgi:hypothetical protein
MIAFRSFARRDKIEHNHWGISEKIDKFCENAKTSKIYRQQTSEREICLQYINA